MTGVGFLGAGAILREGEGIRGLTTAGHHLGRGGHRHGRGFRTYVIAVGCAALVLAGLLSMRVLRGRLLGRLLPPEEEDERENSA